MNSGGYGTFRNNSISFMVEKSLSDVVILYRRYLNKKSKIICTSDEHLLRCSFVTGG